VARNCHRPSTKPYPKAGQSFVCVAINKTRSLFWSLKTSPAQSQEAQSTEKALAVTYNYCSVGATATKARSKQLKHLYGYQRSPRYTK